jgi:hypothetical protein
MKNSRGYRLLEGTPHGSWYFVTARVSNVQNKKEVFLTRGLCTCRNSQTTEHTFSSPPPPKSARAQRREQWDISANSPGLYTPRQVDRLLLSPIFTKVKTGRQILAKKKASEHEVWQLSLRWKVEPLQMTHVNVTFSKCLGHACKNHRCRDAAATKFCTMSPNICGSPVWNLLHVRLSSV